MLSFWMSLKVNEFQQAGYTSVESSDIAEYINDFLWKRYKPLYYVEQVDAIMQITPNQLFDFKSMKIQKQSINLLSELDFGDLID